MIVATGKWLESPECDQPTKRLGSTLGPARTVAEQAFLIVVGNDVASVAVSPWLVNILDRLS